MAESVRYTRTFTEEQRNTLVDDSWSAERVTPQIDDQINLWVEQTKNVIMGVFVDVSHRVVNTNLQQMSTEYITTVRYIVTYVRQTVVEPMMQVVEAPMTGVPQFIGEVPIPRAIPVRVANPEPGQEDQPDPADSGEVTLEGEAETVEEVEKWPDEYQAEEDARQEADILARELNQAIRDGQLENLAPTKVPRAVQNPTPPIMLDQLPEELQQPPADLPMRQQEPPLSKAKKQEQVLSGLPKR